MRLHLRLFVLLFSLFGQLAYAAPASDALGGHDNRTRAADADGRDFADEAVMGDLILQAMSLMGIAYRFGGNNPVNGFDCSGFVRYVFQRSVGVNLPRTAAEQAQMGREVARNDLRPGDIVFFNTRGFSYSHNGLYIGNGKFVHAPRTGKNIEIGNMSSSYWSGRFNGGRRITRGSVLAGNIGEEATGRRKPEVSDKIALAATDAPPLRLEKTPEVQKFRAANDTRIRQIISVSGKKEDKNADKKGRAASKADKNSKDSKSKSDNKKYRKASANKKADLKPTKKSSKKDKASNKDDDKKKNSKSTKKDKKH